jgi:hypothetical protein
MSDHDDPEAPTPLEGPEPSGSDHPAPGGAVAGELGAARGVPGEGDLAGDSDLGGGGAGTDEDPLRTQTAGGS